MSVDAGASVPWRASGDGGDGGEGRGGRRVLLLGLLLHTAAPLTVHPVTLTVQLFSPPPSLFLTKTHRHTLMYKHTHIC